jgi:hypothetical protein
MGFSVKAARINPVPDQDGVASTTSLTTDSSDGCPACSNQNGF